MRVMLLYHLEADVWPVEAGNETGCPLEPQLIADVVAGMRVGGGGEGDERHPGESLPQLAERHILGAEVMPPLGDAVCLVDRDEGEGGPALGRGITRRRGGHDCRPTFGAGSGAAFEAPMHRAGRGAQRRQAIEEPVAHHPLGRDVDRSSRPPPRSDSTRRATPGSSDELYDAARTPLARSASTWSFISEMSGDTTMPVPGRSMAGIW